VTPDFDQFFDANYAGVVRALTLAAGNRDRAEDAAQEAFARACRKWRTVSTHERPVAWVHVVAMNVLRRSFRRKAQEDGLLRVELDGSDDADPAMQMTVHAAIDALPPRQRAVIVLRYLVDLSVAETADALRISTGTVKSTTHDALRSMRIELEDEVVA